MIGATIAGYQIERLLGRGGMGSVFLGRHPAFGRQAAIKVLHPSLSGSEELVTRFFNEARAAALIRHAGIVDVFDFGRLPDGSAYLIMEYLEGETLAALLVRSGRLPTELAVSIARQTAAALGAAHRRGIVHRDLKPDNLFLVADDEVDVGLRVRVLDFGVAKLTADAAGGALLTRTGSFMGTPMYMSPEQCRGAGQVGASTDIYSLGCILFEMATGARPFPLEGLGEIIAAHLHEPPPRPSTLDPGVPPWLDDLILSTLRKRPEDRPPSMEALAQALGARPRSVPPTTSVQLAQPPPTTLGRANGQVIRTPATRRAKAMVLGSAAAVAVALLLALTRTPAEPPAAPAVAVAPPTIAPPAIADAGSADATLPDAAPADAAPAVDAATAAPAPVLTPPPPARPRRRRPPGGGTLTLDPFKD